MYTLEITGNSICNFHVNSVELLNFTDKSHLQLYNHMEMWLTLNKNIFAFSFAAICILIVMEGTSVISDFVKAIPIKAGISLIRPQTRI